MGSMKILVTLNSIASNVRTEAAQTKNTSVESTQVNHTPDANQHVLVDSESQPFHDSSHESSPDSSRVETGNDSESVANVRADTAYDKSYFSGSPNQILVNINEARKLNSYRRKEVIFFGAYLDDDIMTLVEKSGLFDHLKSPNTAWVPAPLCFSKIDGEIKQMKCMEIETFLTLLYNNSHQLGAVRKAEAIDAQTFESIGSQVKNLLKDFSLDTINMDDLKRGIMRSLSIEDTKATEMLFSDTLMSQFGELSKIFKDNLSGDGWVAEALCFHKTKSAKDDGEELRKCIDTNELLTVAEVFWAAYNVNSDSVHN